MIEKEIKKKLSDILTAPKSVQLNHGWNVLTDTESVFIARSFI